MRILALGGSLRQASKNRALLDQAAALAPADAELDLSHLALIGSLPLFNQDILDRDGLPAGEVIGVPLPEDGPWFGQSLYIDRAHERFDEHNRLSDEATREQLRAVITGFAAHCTQLPRTRPS
jgi:hypothetical protein